MKRTTTPAVSVVIPTFARPQQARFIQRSLQSVLRQTFRDLEILVVENGPAGEALQVIEQFRGAAAPPIRYLHIVAQGASVARNVGLREAEGRYIAFLDDDDEWLPAKLARQVAALERTPEAGLVSCRALLVDRAGEIIGERPKFRGTPTLETLVSQGCVILSMSCVLVRRQIADRVGEFNVSYAITDDYDWYLRIARLTRLVVVEEPLVRYMIHDANISKRACLMWDELARAVRAVAPLPSHGVSRGTVRRGIRRCRLHAAGAHYRAASQAVTRRQYRHAIRHYAQATWCDPLVGLRIPWTRFDHPMYRAVRPYLGMARCSLQSFGQEASSTTCRASAC